MINFNSLDISKWFKFPEVLITIGVILLIISIILIIIAYLTTSKEAVELDNGTVKEMEKLNSDTKNEDLLETKEIIMPKDIKKHSSKNADENVDVISTIKDNNEMKNMDKNVTIIDDDEDIELL